MSVKNTALKIIAGCLAISAIVFGSGCGTTGNQSTPASPTAPTAPRSNSTTGREIPAAPQTTVKSDSLRGNTISLDISARDQEMIVQKLGDLFEFCDQNEEDFRKSAHDNLKDVATAKMQCDVHEKGQVSFRTLWGCTRDNRPFGQVVAVHKDNPNWPQIQQAWKDVLTGKDVETNDTLVRVALSGYDAGDEVSGRNVTMPDRAGFRFRVVLDERDLDPSLRDGPVSPSKYFAPFSYFQRTPGKSSLKPIRALRAGEGDYEKAGRQHCPASPNVG